MEKWVGNSGGRGETVRLMKALPPPVTLRRSWLRTEAPSLWGSRFAGSQELSDPGCSIRQEAKKEKTHRGGPRLEGSLG